jgi:hypothetical protein
MALHQNSVDDAWPCHIFGASLHFDAIPLIQQFQDGLSPVKLGEDIPINIETRPRLLRGALHGLHCPLNQVKDQINGTRRIKCGQLIRRI